MRIIDREQIESLLPSLELLPIIEQGFIDYSSGQAVIPPVGELLMDQGEVHIKYGYIEKDPNYVIKIASGFSMNEQLGLANNNGLMLVFNQSTGVLEAILLDEGLLTDIRTAVAGAIVCKYIAPEQINNIGIIGTGVQARLQLHYLSQVCDCRSVMVWGRNQNKLEQYQNDLKKSEFTILPTLDIEELTRHCELLITTTASKTPLLKCDHIRPGTHITAVGSDTPEKQELEVALLEKADYVVADSRPQCLLRGEIHHAINAGAIKPSEILELGDVISNQCLLNRSASDITVADLTGVAVQDIKIAQAVLAAITD